MNSMMSSASFGVTFSNPSTAKDRVRTWIRLSTSTPWLAAAARQRLRPELLAGFGFQALGMNGARCRVGRADLPRDLFTERHAGDEAPRVGRIYGRGVSRPRRPGASRAVESR